MDTDAIKIYLCLSACICGSTLDKAVTTKMAYNEEPENVAADASATALLSPFCRELRSKKFFLMDQLATDGSQYIDGSNHCWCRQTQQVVGPDGGKVHPDRCNSGRSCYSSALADSV